MQKYLLANTPEVFINRLLCSGSKLNFSKQTCLILPKGVFFFKLIHLNTQLYKEIIK